MPENRLREIAAQLDALGEELADLGRGLLGQAIRAESEDESAGLAAQEKRLARARRAVVKAAAVLAGEGPGSDGAEYE
jgi:hypothetical protein